MTSTDPGRVGPGPGRPVALPHLDFADTPATFLGESLESEVFGGDEDARLWNEIDGRRGLDTWAERDGSRISVWIDAGLVLLGPPTRPVATSALPIVLAPHPDDAQLALGGLLAGTHGVVVNVFSDETWTRRPYYADRPDVARRLLVAEDLAACQVLEAEQVCLGFRDGEARPAWKDGFLFQNMFPDLRAAEPALYAEVHAQLSEVAAGNQVVLAPLAVGGHIDHLIVRECVIENLKAGTLDFDQVHFYEDMPYAAFVSSEGRVAEIARSTGRPLVASLVTRPSSTSFLKRESLSAYRLQVTSGMTNRVIRYGERLSPKGFCERLWSFGQGPDGL